MEDPQDKLGDELVSAVSWLAKVGCLVVMGRQGSVHFYHGSIHKVATKQSEDDTGAHVFLRVIKEARAAYESS